MQLTKETSLQSVHTCLYTRMLLFPYLKFLNDLLSLFQPSRILCEFAVFLIKSRRQLYTTVVLRRIRVKIKIILQAML